MKFAIGTSLFLLLLFSETEFTQSKVSLHGKVVDAVTGEALIFANVRLANTSSGSITNKEGFFEVKTSSASQTLITSFIGYHSDTTEVLPNSKETVKIKLLPSSLQLTEVLILAEENPAYAIIRHAIKRKLERSEIKKLPIFIIHKGEYKNRR